MSEFISALYELLKIHRLQQIIITSEQVFDWFPSSSSKQMLLWDF